MNYRIPVSNGLLAPRHFAAIGPALWVFLWLIDRTTREEEGPDGQCWGMVLGYTLVSAGRIAADLGCDEKSVRRYLARLVEKEYVRAERGRCGWRLRVARSKKFGYRANSRALIREGPELPARSGRSAAETGQIWHSRLSDLPDPEHGMTVQKTLQGEYKDGGSRAKRDGYRHVSEMPAEELDTRWSRFNASLPGWMRQRLSDRTRRARTEAPGKVASTLRDALGEKYRRRGAAD